jgi:hypothetical protein
MFEPEEGVQVVCSCENLVPRAMDETGYEEALPPCLVRQSFNNYIKDEPEYDDVIIQKIVLDENERAIEDFSFED